MRSFIAIILLSDMDIIEFAPVTPLFVPGGIAAFSDFYNTETSVLRICIELVEAFELTTCGCLWKGLLLFVTALYILSDSGFLRSYL